ncbi:hypothetical protein GM658_13985 [Pseudoduganella eburnea]|uniref:DUF3106 domain-containing protein n=1 Tax=Massilia eburnea TaxID=1776165 RepID=A0A6L6QHT2_9BURK|nr:hypothetical protein [Massilia eburnea]MTW11711.1 hypothetical protein [Massilia eburnea]
MMTQCPFRPLAFAILLGATNAALASSPIIPLPIDMEAQAVQLNALCLRKAPDLNPPYLKTFNQWKERIGPYYAKYQQWLYDSSTKLAQPGVDLKAKTEELQREQFAYLESHDAEARELCQQMVQFLADPKYDAELKKRVEEPFK